MKIESIREIFNDAGIEACDTDMEYVYEQIDNHFSNSADLSSHTHDFVSKCVKCERYESEISELKKEIECYQNSVKIRRNAKRVWVGGDGGIKYE